MSKTRIPVLIALSFVPRIASAHTPGLSTASFDVDPAAGTVGARFVFATAEPLATSTRTLTLDRDRDGVLTQADVEEAREDLRAFVADGVDVSADGSRCALTSFDASLNEVDGLVLAASYACPRHAASLQVLLYYLSALARSHREVVRISAGSATAEAVLTGERRALSLGLPGGAEAELRRRRTGQRLVALSGLFGALLVGLVFWRLRSARKG